MFISQAQGLASEASGLCETSNMYMHCYASEEKLTAAAQSVAGSMSRLLLVALSKMEAGSEYYQKIQVCVCVCPHMSVCLRELQECHYTREHILNQCSHDY